VSEVALPLQPSLLGEAWGRLESFFFVTTRKKKNKSGRIERRKIHSFFVFPIRVFSLLSFSLQHLRVSRVYFDLKLLVEEPLVTPGASTSSDRAEKERTGCESDPIIKGEEKIIVNVVCRRPVPLDLFSS